MKRFLIVLFLMVSSIILVACDESTTTTDDVTTTEDGVTVETYDYINTRYKNVKIMESYNRSGSDYNYGGIEISIDANTATATIYVIICEDGSEEPTNTQLVAGVSYGDTEVVAAYSAVGTLYQFLDDGDLDMSARYNAYAVIEYNGSYGYMYSTTLVTYSDEELLDKGSGTETDPYKVYTLEDLEMVDYNTSGRENATVGYYILMNNIDLSTKYGEDLANWTPLGYQTGTRTKLEGVFDGQGFTINGLYCVSSVEGTGLFAELHPDAILTNLVLTNVYVETTTQRTAAVVGYNKGTINGVVVLGGTVTSSAKRLGSLSGQCYEAGIISDCYADCDVIGDSGVGGIVGVMSSLADGYSFKVDNCQFSGYVYGSSPAGIVQSISGGTVTNCVVSGATIHNSSSSEVDDPTGGATDDFTYTAPEDTEEDTSTGGTTGDTSTGDTSTGGNDRPSGGPGGTTTSSGGYAISSATVTGGLVYDTYLVGTGSSMCGSSSTGVYYYSVYNNNGYISSATGATKVDLATITSYEWLTETVVLSTSVFYIVDGSFPVLYSAYGSESYSEFYKGGN